METELNMEAIDWSCGSVALNYMMNPDIRVQGVGRGMYGFIFQTELTLIKKNRMKLTTFAYRRDLKETWT